MKKIISVFLAFVLLLSLCACSAPDTSKWQANETFSSVPVYKYADVTECEFSSSMSAKIKKTSYDDFVKYIGDLKEAGFEYFGLASEGENFSLSSGCAGWRCSNGKIFLQLIFNEDGTSGYEMFGANLQIYGYSDKNFLQPESTKRAD